MELNPQEILNFIETQKKVFEDIIIDRDRDDFYKGVLEGMNLVKNYVNMVVDIRAKDIASANEEITSNIKE